MAKKYCSFDELIKLDGYFKPVGTMGKHHCTVVKQNDSIVIIGSVSGRITLQKGDTLGYDCGNVWLVPRPESYKDPVRRVIALAKISQKVLTYSDESVRYTVSFGHAFRDSCADTETGERLLEALGSYKEGELPDTRWNGPDEKGWRGACSFAQEITGGDAIIISQVSSFEPTTSCRSRKVSRIVVRTTADKNKVAEWLEEVITPEGRERRKQREEPQRRRGFSMGWAVSLQP